MRHRAATPSEISIHMSVAAFLRAAWPAELPWTHFPAGERRDERTGHKLKQMGLAKGWPDLVFLLPNAQAAFIELKAHGGQLTAEQTEFRSKVLALKCGYAICSSVDEVEAITGHWLGLFGLKLRARTVARAA